MARKASFGNTLAQHGLNTAAFLYVLLQTNPFCLSLQFSGGESTYSFSRDTSSKGKENGDIGSGGEDAQSKNKESKIPEPAEETGECVSEVKGGQCGQKAQGGSQAEPGPGLPPAELGHGSSSPTQVAPGCGGVIGRGLVGGWVVSGPHSLADPHVVPLSLKVMVASSPPLPSSYLQSSGCDWGGVLLGQRIDGVDG